MAAKRSWTEFVSQNDESVFIIRWSPEKGQPIYYIVLTPKINKVVLQEALDGSARIIQLEDYGKVLHWGYGEPTESIKQEIYEKYAVSIE